MRGLLGRSELPEGEGIVLRPGWSVHTFFMRFPIDVVFVDADQVVVKIAPNLRPWRTATSRGARDVVELAAGECARRGLAVGDRVTWAARPEPRPEASNGAEPRVERASTRAAMRVLIGSRDDSFLRLARFLLARDDVEVEATKRIASAVDLVERNKPHVVVIDATEAIGDAARAVAALEALHRDVGILVVFDGEPPRWATGLKVSEKWAALETLPDDVRLLAEEAQAQASS